MYNLCECELFSLLEAQQQHDHPSSTSTFSSSTAFPNHQAATAHIKMSSMFFDDESEEKKPLAEKEAVQAPSLNPDYMHFRALLEVFVSFKGNKIVIFYRFCIFFKFFGIKNLY
jgi:hypothetical protein